LSFYLKHNFYVSQGSVETHLGEVGNIRL